MYLEIGFIVLGVVLFILLLICIPILINVKRAVHDITVTLEVLNERLPAILKNLEEISSNVNQSTTAVNAEVQKYAATAGRLHHMVSDVASGIAWFAPAAMRFPFMRKVTAVAAVVRGFRAFIRVLRGKK